MTWNIAKSSQSKINDCLFITQPRIADQKNDEDGDVISFQLHEALFPNQYITNWNELPFSFLFLSSERLAK